MSLPPPSIYMSSRHLQSLYIDTEKYAPLPVPASHHFHSRSLFRALWKQSQALWLHFEAFLSIFEMAYFLVKNSKKEQKTAWVVSGVFDVFWLQKIEKCHLHVKFNQELRQSIGKWWESTWVHYFAHSLVISKRNLTREAKKWQKWAFFSLFAPKGQFLQKKSFTKNVTSNPGIDPLSQFGTKK